MFKDTAKHNKCYVPINKLTPDLLYVHQPSKQSPSIDPYSNLEDIGDSHSETHDVPTNQTAEEPWKTYNLRTRRNITTRHSDKPLCSNRTEINYADLFKSDSDADTAKEKKSKRQTPVPKSPTSSRIAAQGIKSEPPKSKHPVPLLPPNKCFHRTDAAKAKPIHR